MAPSRAIAWQHMPLILLSLAILALARPTLADASPPVDLICHTSNPAECYPRIFQPAEHFQAVRDDQEIPPGLHVRLNIQTGEKEARLNVPGAEAANPALVGLPVDSAVIVVEPATGEGARQGHDAAEQLKTGAPRHDHDPAGRKKIKPPPTTTNGPFDGVLNLARGLGFKVDSSVDDALEALRDIAHDMYYGLKIAEDTEAVKSLLCLAVSPDGAGGPLSRDQEAAYVLAGALQNNPSALEAVAQAWDELMAHRCQGGGGGGGGGGPALDEAIYAGLAASSSPSAAAHAKARASAINGLIKSAPIRAHFLARVGMRRLLRVLREDGPEWEGAQRRVGQLAIDNFLDTDMGAETGAWPSEAPLADWHCRRQAGTGRGATGDPDESVDEGSDDDPDEGCWRFHAARLAQKYGRADGGAWSRELFERLDKLARTGGGRKTKPARVDL